MPGRTAKFGSATGVAIGVVVKEGTIFTPETLAKIDRITKSIDGIGASDQLPAYDSQTDAREELRAKMEELIHHFINVTQGVNAPPGEIYFAAENPKGELGFYINSRGGGVPHRLKIRAPSFVNLSILPELLPACMMSDVVAILGSLDFVMGECDR
jgi:NADH-quinone oxidoreductase subunit D